MQQLDDRLERLYSAGLTGVWIVDVDQIACLDDLLNARPHSIIRTYDTGAVRFVQTDSGGIEGCVAGWISDESEVDESRGAHG